MYRQPPYLSSVRASLASALRRRNRLLLEIGTPGTPAVHIRIDTQLICRETLAEQQKEAEAP